MKLRITALVMLAGCSAPPTGVLDGGSDAGEADAGTLVIDNDGGLLNLVGGGTAACGAFPWKGTKPTCTAVDAGCVALFRDTQAPVLIFASSTAYDHWYGVSGGPDFYVFAARRGDARLLAAVPALGGTPQDIEVWPAGAWHQVYTAVWDGASLVYVFEHRQTAGSAPDVSLRRWNSMTGLVEVLATNLGTVHFNGLDPTILIEANSYLVALNGGIARVPKSGGPAQMIVSGEVGALAGVGPDFFYSLNKQLFRVPAGGSAVLVANLDARGIAMVGDKLLVLTFSKSEPGGVYEIKGSTATLRLAQFYRPFSLAIRQLRGSATKAYVSRICSPPFMGDFDIYATMELDLAAGTASWITGTPGWPYLTPFLDLDEIPPQLLVPRVGTKGIYVSGSW